MPLWCDTQGLGAIVVSVQQVAFMSFKCLQSFISDSQPFVLSSLDSSLTARVRFSSIHSTDAYCMATEPYNPHCKQ